MTSRPSICSMRRFEIRRHEIDHLQTEGLLGGNRFALPDRLLHPVLISRPLLGDSPDVGDGIVFHLLAHGLVHAPPIPRAHGMGRADVRPGRHGGDVGRHGDDEPGRGRPCPGGRHIDDDGHGGVQDPLGDVPHGQIQTARRIQTDDQPLRAAFGRLTDTLEDVLGDRRRDGGADRDDVEDRRLVRRRQILPGQQNDDEQCGRHRGRADDFSQHGSPHFNNPFRSSPTSDRAVNTHSSSLLRKHDTRLFSEINYSDHQPTFFITGPSHFKSVPGGSS